jgi:hypothetical protein
MGGQHTIPIENGPEASAVLADSALPRRGLLGGAGIALGAAVAPPGMSPIAPAAAQPIFTEPPARQEPPARSMDGAMRRRAVEVREACARRIGETPIAPHPANGDEARYPNKIGSDTRGLPHNARGEVNPAAWQAFQTACQSGEPADFEKIPLGGPRRLINPVGTLAVSLCGCTPTQIAIPPAPALAGAERAGEAVEVYWQALLRDVPFAEFRDGTDNREVLAACEELMILTEVA